MSTTTYDLGNNEMTLRPVIIKFHLNKDHSVKIDDASIFLGNDKSINILDMVNEDLIEQLSNEVVYEFSGCIPQNGFITVSDVYLHPDKCSVEAFMSPEEPATRHYPGCPASVEIESLTATMSTPEKGEFDVDVIDIVHQGELEKLDSKILCGDLEPDCDYTPDYDDDYDRYSMNI